MKRTLICAAIAGMLLSATAGRAARTETARYELGLLGDNYSLCDGFGPPPADETARGNYGGACFDVEPGDMTVVVVAQDDVMPAVGVAVAAFSAAGVRMGATGAGCVAATTQIPAGAAYVKVYTYGAAFSALVCGLPLPATMGEIKAEFS